MGRGRQRAKDAKIARQLKYAGAGTDLRALERELVGTGEGDPSAVDDALIDDTDDWDAADER
jgi:phage replication-related protein YjqB (UPF0714/DUF867 family)